MEKVKHYAEIAVVSLVVVLVYNKFIAPKMAAKAPAVKA